MLFTYSSAKLTLLLSIPRGSSAIRLRCKFLHKGNTLTLGFVQNFKINQSQLVLQLQFIRSGIDQNGNRISIVKLCDLGYRIWITVKSISYRIG